MFQCPCKNEESAGPQVLKSFFPRKRKSVLAMLTLKLANMKYVPFI
jgi:hypothetical protein